MVKLIYILMFLSLLNGQNIIDLRFLQKKVVEKEYIHHSHAIHIKNDTLFINEINKISKYTIDGEHIKSYPILPESSYIYSFDILYPYIVTQFINRHNGICYMGLYKMEKDTLLITEHHAWYGKVFFWQDAIINISAYFPRYYQWLMKYDENTRMPSTESLQAFKRFYENNTAFTISKYNMNLSIIDSANYIERHGDNYQGYEYLQLKETYYKERDKIYIVHKSAGYLIRKYDSNLKLTFEFGGENPSFIPVPDNLTKKKAERMRRIPNTYSNIYFLSVINDTIITSFYQNVRDFAQPEPPFYYDIFNQSGEILNSGILPYQVYTYDNKNNLYFLVKQERRWPFGQDKYYLVSFTLKDLMHNRISEKWVKDQIKHYTGGK